MIENRSTTMETQARKDTGLPGQANGQNDRHPSPGPLSWYAAQRPEPGPTYALTSNGYVVL